MKKLTKAALGTAAVGAAGAWGLLNILDRLLVDKNWTVPQSLSDKISGMDGSALDDLLNENLNWLENWGYEKFHMLSCTGHSLTGYLMKAKEPSDAYVFCSHGYRSSGKNEFCGIAQYYLQKGFNVFLVDHVASGESGGKNIGFGYFESKDCLKWLDMLTSTFGENIKIILHGISMGAATVMLMSGDDELPENVKMIVSDCGYTSAWDEFEHKAKDLKIPHPVLTVVNEINKVTAGYDFKDTNALDSVKKAKVPMLFVHGSADDFVPTKMVYEVYDACGSEIKDLLVVEGADHAHSFVVGKDEYEKKLDEFIGKCGI